MLIDLQLHSTYSDGYLTPSEIVDFISKQGVKVASLTDHNTVSGLGEFRSACNQAGIKSIVGIEIYVKLHGYRFNVLWYNFNYADPELHNVLRDSQVRRKRMMRRLLSRLEDVGFEIDVEKILDKYNHYVPLNHVADDLMASKKNMAKIRRELKVDNPREGMIIGEYFQNKNIYKLGNAYMDMDVVLRLKKRIGGQVIICHPAKGSYIGLKFLKDLKAVGIDGVEKMSPHHSYGAVVHIQQMARELDLIETGGSDFHRFEEVSSYINCSWDYFKIDSDPLRRIQEVIG